MSGQSISRNTQPVEHARLIVFAAFDSNGSPLVSTFAAWDAHTDARFCREQVFTGDMFGWPSNTDNYGSEMF